MPEFQSTVLAKMAMLGVSSQTQLADLSGVNRGSMSKIFRGRPASAAVRSAISSFLDFTEEERIRFLCVYPPKGDPKPMLLGDYQYPHQTALARGYALLHQGFYVAAIQEFNCVFNAAEHVADPELQADAAGRAALACLEIGQFNAARQWAHRSIAKCCQCIGMTLPEIIRTAPRYSPVAAPSKPELALRILSDTLHNLCQIYVRQMLYFGKRNLERSARLGLDTCLKLDRRLDLAQPAGNDLRCQAAVEAMTQWADSRLAFRLIEECKENFASSGLFEAHWLKTCGIIQIQTDRLAQGRKLLTKADEMLELFPDARGLALERYMLSDAILRTSGDRRLALRYIISAAALHPYGWVIERCRQEALHADRRNLQTEIDDLIQGKGLYSPARRMATWLAQESSHSGEDLLFRNISMMTAGNFPQIELPNRPEPRQREQYFLNDQQRASKDR